jgi:hypothetical protein
VYAAENTEVALTLFKVPLITTLYAEHGPQNTPPHSLQWCLRFVRVNALEQREQLLIFELSFHSWSWLRPLNSSSSVLTLALL